MRRLFGCDRKLGRWRRLGRDRAGLDGGRRRRSGHRRGVVADRHDGAGADEHHGGEDAGGDEHRAIPRRGRRLAEGGPLLGYEVHQWAGPRSDRRVHRIRLRLRRFRERRRPPTRRARAMWPTAPAEATAVRLSSSGRRTACIAAPFGCGQLRVWRCVITGTRSCSDSAVVTAGMLAPPPTEATAARSAG